ncbi:hypothetical protein D5086_028119 [Populus alba]|uniref:Uncharacterized protein n=1 Tax=Populus alba TaxID=43335 RepID=A0ACC4AXJ9_POPAL
MAYHLRLDFNLIKGFAIVVEGGAEADTPVKWCLSPWQRKGGLCKTDHDERRRWFPLVCLLGESRLRRQKGRSCAGMNINRDCWGRLG